MNKVLARNLFSKYTPKARAHGTGITKLVVDDEGAQHLAGGTGPQGVVAATPDNSVYAENNDVQDVGLPSDQYDAITGQKITNAPTATMSAKGAVGPSNYENILARYQGLANKALGPERSYEDLVAQREKIIGPQDTKFQQALGIMALGGRIMSTPGSVGSAIGAALPEFAATMGKISSEEQKLRQQIRASAMDTYERDKLQRQTVGLDALKTAFTEAAGEDRLTRTIAAQYGVTGTDSFAVPDSSAPLGYTIMGARRTENGIVGLDGKPLPQGAFPADPTFLASLRDKDVKAAVDIQIMQPDGTYGPRTTAVQKGQTFHDATNGKPITAPFRLFNEKMETAGGTSNPFVILDPNSNFGIREVIGFTDPVSKQNFYVEGGMKVFFDSGKGIQGKLTDVLKTRQDGNATIQTPTFGPYQGQNFKFPNEPTGAGDKIPIPNSDPKLAEEILRKQAAAGAPAATTTMAAATTAAGGGDELSQAVAQAQNATVQRAANNPARTIGAITGDGPERYFVKKDDKPFVTYSKMTDKQLEESNNKIDAGQKYLRSLDDLLAATSNATGPVGTMKSLSTRYLGTFTPEKFSGWTEFYNNAAAVEQMKIARQQVREAFSQNDRHPLGEIKITDDLVAQPEKFFQNPKEAMVRIQTLGRELRNQIEFERARQENRPPLYLERIPTGTENDPFPADKQGYLLELKNNGINLNGVHYRTKDGLRVIQ